MGVVVLLLKLLLKVLGVCMTRGCLLTVFGGSLRTIRYDVKPLNDIDICRGLEACLA